MGIVLPGPVSQTGGEMGIVLPGPVSQTGGDGYSLTRTG